MDDGATPPLSASEPVATGKIKRQSKRNPPERSERVAQTMGRGMSRLAAFSMLINVLLVVAVLHLANRPPSVFLLQESNGKFYQARGPVEETNVMKTLLEKFARRYVLQRETVNRVDDKTRFEWVKENSSSSVWKQFNTLMVEDGFYQAAIRNQTSWTIDIANVWPSNDANRFVWSLEVIKTHYQKGKRIGRPEAWVIELRMDRDGRKKTPAQNLDNPAALFVAAYNARPKEAVVKGRAE